MRLRIVVAAADSRAREHLFGVLNGLGHDVATVGHVRALLGLCRSFEPDLVAAGVEMGEAARQVAVPFILLGDGRLRRDEMEAVLALVPPPGAA